MRITVRRVAAVVGAVVLGGMLFVRSPAGAVVGPPSGTIPCTIGGTVTIKPALTTTPGKRAPTAKAATTTGTCNDIGVNNGKAPSPELGCRARVPRPRARRALGAISTIDA